VIIWKFLQFFNKFLLIFSRFTVPIFTFYLIDLASIVSNFEVFAIFQ